MRMRKSSEHAHCIEIRGGNFEQVKTSIGPSDLQGSGRFGSTPTRKVSYRLQMVIQGQVRFPKPGLLWLLPPVV